MSKRRSPFVKTVLPLFLLFGLLVLPALSEGAVLYVRPGGTGDGASWAAASADLAAVLEGAVSGDEVWVAAGTYRPHAASRDVAFTLKDGVALYGGFVGIETDLDERDPATNVTILTGDLASNDHFIAATGYDGTTGNDNSYHVVYAPASVTASAILDGFTVTGGNANGDADQAISKGGGMHNAGGSPAVRVCTFTANFARYGGGMYNFQGSPTVTDCTFSNNVANFTGGGMENYQGAPTVTSSAFSGNAAGNDGGGMYSNASAVTVSACTFSANSAGRYGGGMTNLNGTPTVTGCTFSGNSAVGSGGGMRNDGGTATVRACTFSGNSADKGGGMSNSTGSPTVTNCTFSGNSAATHGGGMSNDTSIATVTNCTFSANTATSGHGMYAQNSTLTVTNSIFWGTSSTTDQVAVSGGTATITYSVTDQAGTANTGADPRLGPLAANGGATKTCALLAGSSALNSGTSTGAPATDQRGVARPQGAGFDMGAYEAVPAPTPPTPPAPGPGPTPGPEPDPEPEPEPIPVQPSPTPIMSSDVILPSSDRVTMAVPMIVTISGDATEQERTDRLREALRRALVPEVLIEDLVPLLAIDGTGQVYIKGEVMAGLLPLSTDMEIKDGTSGLSLPFFRALIQARAQDQATNEAATAVVFFQIPDCFRGRSSDLLQIVKVLSSDTVLPYSRIYDLSDLTDGRFAVLETEATSAGPEVKGTLSGDDRVSERCIVAMALSDGGSFDLDGRDNGSVTDPAFMIEGIRKESPASSGGGGCAAGPFSPALLTLLVPLALLWRAGK